ncbi:MAG TPA: AAA family ATPase [Longimicrobium sp.]|jgi:protein phosphatase
MAEPAHPPDARTLAVPELALVLLIGPSGCGKSTFARRGFAATEIVSSDQCRAWVSDDENDQGATADAFEVLHLIVARRLARGRLTVVDATSVTADSRRPLLELARRFHVPAAAIVLDIPEEECLRRNAARAGRQVPPEAIQRQMHLMRASIGGLAREGFRHVHHLRSTAELDAASVVRHPLPGDRRHDPGPFDIIGDVHGCAAELAELLALLGYAPGPGGAWRHPEGRTAVFLGDLVDRGPGVVPVLRRVMAMAAAGTALCVPGNHDAKLVRALRGRNVQVKHGLAESLVQIRAEPPGFAAAVARFIDGLPTHYLLDGGRLVVAHAGMKAALQGRDSGAVRSFALFGETTGETDELGLPVRVDWAADYRGTAEVVYGHTPVATPEWVNGTLNIDTGCVFGGRLTALRYPEHELVSVPARHAYAAPRRPFLPQHAGDVGGVERKRIGSLEG